MAAKARRWIPAGACPRVVLAGAGMTRSQKDESCLDSPFFNEHTGHNTKETWWLDQRETVVTRILLPAVAFEPFAD